MSKKNEQHSQGELGLGNRKQKAQNRNEIVVSTETQTESVSTGTAQETPKETIAQKVEKLTAEQTQLNANLAGMAADAPERANVETRLAEIARKIRWYEGRSGNKQAAAPKAPKAQRPSKAASKSAKSQATATATEQPAVTSAASES